MRYFIIVLLFVPLLTVYGQHYTKQYVTKNGDTIKPGTTIKIASVQSFSFIYPSAFDANNKAPLPISSLEKAKQYLLLDMPGHFYSVSRLTRVKIGKNEYKYIVVIKINNYHIDPVSGIDFMIPIEEALNKGEVTLIN